MRRWILIFVVAVQAAILITLSGPMGATGATSPSPSYTFKGKASVYYRTPIPPYTTGTYSPYFVVNFSCQGGALSGNWTWDTSNEHSYGGTLALPPTKPPPPPCSLTSTTTSSGVAWSSGSSMLNINLYPRNGITATLSLTLTNISATKTYVSNTTTWSPTPPPNGTSGCVGNPGTPSNPPPVPCIGISTTGLGQAVVPTDRDGDFYSNPEPLSDATAPYGTLTLSVG